MRLQSLTDAVKANLSTGNIVQYNMQTQPLKIHWRSALCAAIIGLSALVAPPQYALAQTAPTAPVPQTKPAKKPPAPKPPEEDPEIKMGREAHAEMLRSGLRLVTDPALVSRVETIGKKITATANVTPLEARYGSSKLVPYDYKFFIVDDKDINAFSLPGGYIYVNKGLLNYIQSDDELAGVLGHEIIHAAHHHVMRLQKEQSKLNTQLLLGTLATLLARVPAGDALNLLQGFQLIAIQKVNGFGQDAERDADHGGLTVAAKSGYNPVGMLTFMERLERDQHLRPEIEWGIYRTHPPEKERVANITTQLNEMGVTINRRAVTNMFKVEVRTVAINKDVQAFEVLLDQKPLYRTSSNDRAKATAKKLDSVLDKDIQIYDVTKKGNEVFVRGESIVSIAAQDTDLPGSPKPDEVADAFYRRLRFALFRQGVESGI